MKKHKKYRLKPRIKKVLLSSVMILTIAVLGIVLSNNGTNILNSVKNYFAAGDVPEHEKNIEDNGNGTYKLSLTVKGDADTDVHTAANVNVLIVYDESSSMTSNNVTTNPNRNRADYAEDVVHDFIAGLQRYQQGDGSNIQVALVGFGASNNAVTRQSWTSDLSSGNNGVNRFFDDGVDGTITNSGANSHGYSNNNGTNWQAALQQAELVLNDADSDPTFVILVTDGAPTAARGYTTINPSGNHQWTDFRTYYNEATDEAYAIQSRENTTLYGIYAYGKESDLLDELIYYSNNGSHRVIDGYNVSTCNANQHNFGGTEATDKYYNANNTAALNTAIESIFQTIVNALGISSVQINDGTTNKVQTSTGEISELLEVDESSYQYWLSIPVVNNQFQRINMVSGQNETYTVSCNESTGKCTVAWGNNSVEVKGSISGGQLKYEWTEANALYNYNPPVARLVNGAVNWNLSSVGTLLDGVTYEVTFDVYPSQETYDMIADLKNGTITYDELDSGIQPYILDQGNGSYSLRTNTTATLSYDDTRDAAGVQTKTYDNPDPVATNVDTIAVKKTWDNNIDKRKDRTIQLELKRDGKKAYDVSLPGDGEDPWIKDGIYIATGLAKTDTNGELIILDEGHDYTFGELGSELYNWELESITVHPMLIDGELTELTLIEDATSCPSGETCYTIKNKLYKVSGTNPTISAINHRRSNINIKKIVEGENANPNDEFEFTITITQKDENNSIIASSDNENFNDYLWFSVQDKDGNWVDYGDEITGWGRYEGEDNETGKPTYYYHAPNGTELTIKLKDEYNIRFTNLVSNTDVNIVEGDTTNYDLATISQEGFSSEETGKSKIEINDVESKTFKANIGENNKSYKVEYTNTNTAPETVEATVTKIWNDNNDQDGIRPTSIIMQLLADGTPLENKTVTLNNDKLTDKISGLPKYSNGKEVEYTWEESTLPEGYSMTSKIVIGNTTTFTNTHEPEKTRVSVTKVWNDNSNQDGFRPETITIKVLDGTTVVDSNTQVTGSNTGRTWSFTSKELPKYRNGQEIQYTVSEEFTTDPEDAYTQGTPSGNVKDGFTITNTHEPKKTQVKATKIWADNNNQDDLRPDSITFTLTKGGEEVSNKTCVANKGNNWSCSIQDLDEYENGSKIVYGIKELGEIDGYTTSQPVCTGNTCSVTNELTSPKKTQVKVTKEWVDDGNSQNTRPTTITLKLYGNDKTKALQEVQVSAVNNKWEHTFTDLDKNFEGKAIDYSVEEVVPENYTQQSNDCKESKEACTITNIVDDLSKTYPVKKTWNDGNNQDGMRKEVTVTLTGTVEGSEWKYTDTKELSDPNWADVFENIPVFHEGKLVSYSVTEEAITFDSTQHSTGYTTTYNNDYIVEGVKGTEVINTHTPELITVSVTKVWNDNSNQDGFRPGTITIKVLDGTTVVDSNTQVTGSNTGRTWSFTSKELPKYRNGQEIQYTVSEEFTTDPEDAYTQGTPSGNVKDGFTITNTHEPKKTQVKATKIWADNNNQDDLRPDSITFTLTKGGEEVSNKTCVANKGNNWSCSIQDLDEYENGSKIVYGIKELGEIDGYTTSQPVCTGNTCSVTNELTSPKKTQVKVTKEWIDDGNSQNTRPTTITLKLYGNDKTKALQEVQVSAVNNKWEHTFTDLDKNFEGKAIDYSVEEVVPENYTQQSNDCKESKEACTITNIVDDLSKTYPVKKTWNDGNNQDGMRKEVTVTLTGTVEGSEWKYTDTKELSDPNWADVFENIPVFHEGKLVSYSVTEEAITFDSTQHSTGYTTTYNNDYIVEGVKGTEVINTHTPELITVSVTKVWNDNSNQDGFRPGTITIKVLDGTTVVDSNTQVTGSNTGRTWSFTSKELPKYRNGQEIQYTVSEEFTTDPEDAYTQGTPSGNVKDGFTITNTHEPKKTQVKATKIWADNNNQDDLRPDSITFTLTKGGEEVSNKTCVANKGNNWSCSIQDLDEYENGSKIVYGIKELGEIDGYTTSQPVCTGNTCSVTNELTSPKKTQVKVTKEWVDDGNSQNTRPTTITLKLYGNDKTKALQEVQVSAVNNKWEHTFTDLDKNFEGKAIDYSVEEVVPENYTQQSNDCKESKEACTITNIVDDLSKTYPVKKTWNDGNNQDGMRKTVTVTLTGTVEGSNWTYTDTKELSDPNWADVFENIPVFHEGKLISYSVTEEAITFDSTQHSTGYTTTYNNEYIVDEVKGTEVINTHEPEKTSISGTKTWKDNNNAYSTRPESITINLLKNGVKVDSTTAPDKDGNWTYSFTDLDKYENGNLIIYSLSEEPVKDYKTTTEEGNSNNFINTLSRITSITGQKSWNDNDITEYRPGSLILVLYRNGTEVGRETVNSTSNWSNTWNNLDEFDENGVKYNYTVDESDPDGTLEYYTKEQTGDENNNYTVKNKLETTKVKVTKEWIDDNNSQDTRPENIKVYLYKNGGTEVFKEATIEPKDGKWEYTFEDLPKQSNGEDIVYTVDEVVPPKYAKVSIEGDMNSGYTITNKVLDSITKEYPVKKTWVDDGNRDGLRTEITVTLTGTVTGTDYEETYTKSLNEGNNWEDTFTDIPVFNDGKLISYQVKESEIPIESPHTYGYDTEYNYDYSVEGVSGCEIINTHDPEKIKISGTKKWDDFDDEDGIRPDTITINLIKNGNSEPFATKEVTPVDGSWEFEFSNLYKFENGQKVNYTIEEVVPEGYTREIKPDEEGINVEVINTHMPKVTFNIHKDWNDYDNNDGKRPESITVRLLRNGIEITNTTITGPNWSTLFKDLDKYDSEGNEYDYTIKEDTVEFYAENPLIEYGEDNSINITNTHELIKLEDIIVKKVWKDDNNKNNSRPTSIHINLLADGEKVDEATLSESNGWTYTFTGKLKYKAGKEIVYTVTEDTVKYYDASINGYEITNTYNGPVIEITPPNTGISIDTTNTDSNMSLLLVFMMAIAGFLLRKKYN